MVASMPSSSWSSRRNACFGGFAWLHLAAGKLPLGAEGLIGTALTDQHLVAAQDQSSCDWTHCLGLIARVVTRLGGRLGRRAAVRFRHASVLCCSVT